MWLFVRVSHKQRTWREIKNSWNIITCWAFFILCGVPGLIITWLDYVPRQLLFEGMSYIWHEFWTNCRRGCIEMFLGDRVTFRKWAVIMLDDYSVITWLWQPVVLPTQTNTVTPGKDVQGFIIPTIEICLCHYQMTPKGDKQRNVLSSGL